MRTAPLTTIDPEDDVGIADGETIFNGLLLAVIGRRRLLVLVGDAPATRVGLLARLARHVEGEGCLVMTVAAATGVTVEDLIEVAGSSMLGPDCTPANFEELVDALEERLDLAGTGVLMIEEADRLSPDTLRDLVDLSGSLSPSGRFLQVLLSGGPELRNRLERADLLPTIEAVGTIYTVGPTIKEDHRELRAAGDAPVFAARREAVGEKPSRKGRWLAALMIGVLALAGGAFLYDAGVLEDQRVAELFGLEQQSVVDAESGPHSPPPEFDTQSDWYGSSATDAGSQVADPDGFAAEQGEPEDTLIVSPETPAPDPAMTVTQAPETTRDADRTVLEEPANDTGMAPGAASTPTDLPLYSAEDVERFSEFAGRVLNGEETADLAPAATAPTDLPDPARETPPPEESLPLDAEELAVLEDAEQAADAELAEEAGTTSGDDDVALAPPPGPTEAELRQLRTLGQRAETQFASRKLTTPPTDNAFTTLQAIRAIDPGHPLLTDMRERILDTYQAWASTAESRQDWRTARIYYQRALRVDPANPEITAKLDAVDDRLVGRTQTPQTPQPDEAPPEPRLRP